MSEWPRWFAISRAVSPALSSLAATVLRNVWLRAHGKPASSKSFRMARTVFDRSRRIPFGLGRIGLSGRAHGIDFF